MKKLLFSLALVGAVIPSFAVNSVNWEILRNPVDGESGFPMTASGRQLFVDFNNDGIMDYFIIAGGASKPQLQAMINNVQEKMHEAGFDVKRIEGNRDSSWILMDYGDLIVHIFSRDDRLFYDLERIWRDGKVVGSVEELD